VSALRSQIAALRKALVHKGVGVGRHKLFVTYRRGEPVPPTPPDVPPWTDVIYIEEIGIKEDEETGRLVDADTGAPFSDGELRGLGLGHRLGDQS
jgi:hypothetical protein